MKVLFSFFIFTFSFSFLSSQTHDLKQALKKGKRNGVYSVKFGRYFNPKNVKDWIIDNNYIMIQSVTADFPVFGDWKNGYSSIHFMSRNDYEVAMAEINRHKAELAKIDREKSNDNWLSDFLINGAKVVGAVGIGIGLWKILNRNEEASSFNNSTTSSHHESKIFEYLSDDKPHVTRGESPYIFIDVKDGGVLSPNVCKNWYSVSYQVNNETKQTNDPTKDSLLDLFSYIRESDLPITVDIRYKISSLATDCESGFKYASILIKQTGSYTVNLN